MQILIHTKNTDGWNSAFVICYHLVVLCVFTAFKGSFYIWTIYLLFASTFKPNGSLSSTDENKEKSNYKDWKSESDLVEALISSPKVCLPINQAHLITFSFTRYQLPVFASLNKSAGSQIKCCCKIECVQSLLACWKKNSRPPLTPPSPPGSTCRVFTSPPPPLVIRKLQGGGTSNLVPNKSCQ